MRTKFDIEQKSSKFLLEIMTLVLSANNSGSRIELIFSRRSFTCIMNNTDPRIDPWWTPCHILTKHFHMVPSDVICYLYNGHTPFHLGLQKESCINFLFLTYVKYLANLTFIKHVKILKNGYLIQVQIISSELGFQISPPSNFTQ
jgi:hypothetical protein